MVNQETTPVGAMIIKAEANYITETPRHLSEILIFPYSFDATETMTDILTVIRKMNSLYYQKEHLTLEAHKLMFSPMGNFQNVTTLYETLSNNSDVSCTLKPCAENSPDLHKMHNELYELLKFFSQQLTNDSTLKDSVCFGGDIIEQTVNTLNKKYSE